MFPALIVIIILAYFAGLDLFTFTTLHEFNGQDTPTVIFASFIWGLIGALPIISGWALYRAISRIGFGVANALTFWFGGTFEPPPTIYQNLMNWVEDRSEKKSDKGKKNQVNSLLVLWIIFLLGGLWVFWYMLLYMEYILSYRRSYTNRAMTAP